MRKFMPPFEIGYGEAVPYIHTFNRVEDNLRRHQFRFEIPFGEKKWFLEIKKALNDQGWNINEIVTENITEWEIKPR